LAAWILNSNAKARKINRIAQGSSGQTLIFEAPLSAERNGNNFQGFRV